MRPSVLISSAIALSLTASAAGAQQASPPQATRDRPSSRELTPPAPVTPDNAANIEVPAAAAPASTPNQPGASFLVSRVEFFGNKVVSTGELTELAAPYINRSLTTFELEELRQKISRRYLDKGYINSGAVLTPDAYSDGVVRMRIIEGRLTDVRATGLGRLQPSYLRQRLQSADETLDVDVLQERFQLLLTDPLFKRLNARLQPGANLGEAILDVDVTRARAWDLETNFNNYRSPAIGSNGASISGVVRNLSSFGDTLDGTYELGEEDAYRYSVGSTLPLPFRTSLSLRYNREESTVLEKPLDVLDLESSLESYDVGLQYAPIERVKQRLAFGFNYNRRESSTELLGEPFSFIPGEDTGTSTVDAKRFSQEYLRREQRWIAVFRSTYTTGRTNVRDSGTAAPGTPDSSYTSWLGQGQLTRLLADNGTRLTFRGTIQLTPDNLVPIERIAIGGINSVRGYRENTLVRDEGYFLNLDLRVPAFESASGQQKLFLTPFVDYGRARSKLEGSDDLASVGLGVSYQLGGFTADLTYGKQLIDAPVDTDDDLQDDGIQFQVKYSF